MAAANHGALEHVEGGEKGGGAVALAIIGHRSGLVWLERQPSLGAVERLDLGASRLPRANPKLFT
jgi:hypothetical protein